MDSVSANIVRFHNLRSRTIHFFFSIASLLGFLHCRHNKWSYSYLVNTLYEHDKSFLISMIVTPVTPVTPKKIKVYH